MFYKNKNLLFSLFTGLIPWLSVFFFLYPGEAKSMDINHELFAYDGEVLDEGAGLTYLHSRFYGDNGQFVSEDSFAQKTWNRYAAFNDDPLVEVDPMGTNAVSSEHRTPTIQTGGHVNGGMQFGRGLLSGFVSYDTAQAFGVNMWGYKTEAKTKSKMRMDNFFYVFIPMIVGGAGGGIFAHMTDRTVGRGIFTGAQAFFALGSMLAIGIEGRKQHQSASQIAGKEMGALIMAGLNYAVLDYLPTKLFFKSDAEVIEGMVGEVEKVKYVDPMNTVQDLPEKEALQKNLKEASEKSVFDKGYVSKRAGNQYMKKYNGLKLLPEGDDLRHIPPGESWKPKAYDTY